LKPQQRGRVAAPGSSPLAARRQDRCGLPGRNDVRRDARCACGLAARRLDRTVGRLLAHRITDRGAIFVWLCKHGPLVGVVALPETRRQIAAEVFGGSLVRGAYRFGFELATGVRTYAGVAAPYVLLLAIVLVRPTLAQALLIGAGFGVGRAVPLVARLIGTDGWRARPFWRRMSPVTQTVAALLVLIGGLSLV
jgi:hypothetical protein